MNKDPFVILLILFVILGLAWEPIKNGSFGNISTSTSNYSLFPVFDSGMGYEEPPRPITERDVSARIRETQETAEALQKELELEARRKKQSPHAGKITIYYVSSLNNPDPSGEYITLFSNLNPGEKVNVTGWKLQSSRTGNWIKIGQASTLPYPYAGKNYQDVVVQQGDSVYLIKGFSPIGISFRSNKCTGFFGEYRTFTPYINRSCPLPINEDLPQFSSNLDREDECLDLIEQIPACVTPQYYLNFRNLPDTVPQSCKDYLRTEVNYDTCVEKHIGDTDFPGREWYVYMNLFGSLWRNSREHITLYDQNGLVVSEISY